MPKKPDPSLKTKSGIYLSQIEQNKAYDEKVDKIVVRIPEGSRAALTKYVEKMAAADPENPKYSSYNGRAYRASVNAFVRTLIEEELEMSLDELKSKQ